MMRYLPTCQGFIIAVAAIAVIGCGKSQEKTSTDTKPEIGTEAAASAEWTTTPSGLQYIDKKVGDGEMAANGMTVEVHYAGYFWENGQRGEKFDASTDRGEPFQFQIGAGRVIKGWEEGVAGMKIGGNRELLISPDLAWGDRGFGNLIPPNATVYFDVTLLRIVSQ